MTEIDRHLRAFPIEKPPDISALREEVTEKDTLKSSMVDLFESCLRMSGTLKQQFPKPESDLVNIKRQTFVTPSPPPNSSENRYLEPTSAGGHSSSPKIKEMNLLSEEERNHGKDDTYFDEKVDLDLLKSDNFRDMTSAAEPRPHLEKKSC